MFVFLNLTQILLLGQNGFPIIQCKCSIVYIYGLFTWVLICVDSVFSCAWLVVLYWTLTQIVDHILIFRSFEHNSSWGYEDHSL